MINNLQIIDQKKGNATFTHRFDAHPVRSFIRSRYRNSNRVSRLHSQVTRSRTSNITSARALQKLLFG